MIITEIRKRKGRLVAVYSEQGQVCLLDKTVADEYGVREGAEFSWEDIESISKYSQEKRAKDKALWLLAHRDHSKKELTEKIMRTTDAQSAEKAVEQMQELGYIDDKKYAKHLANHLLFVKFYSSKKTEYELIKKGIDREISREIIEYIAPDPQEQLCALIERKFYAKLSNEADRRRTFAALLRLGYNSGDIRSAIRKYISDEDFEE